MTVFIYLFIAGISVLIGFVFSFLLYPVVYFFHTAVIAPFKGMKYRKNNEYKTVEAKLSAGSLRPYENGQGTYTAVYDYYVDGKKYSKVISKSAFNYFSDTINLYYCKNPKKAVERVDSLGKIEDPKPVRRIIRVVSSIVIFVVLVVIWISL